MLEQLQDRFFQQPPLRADWQPRGRAAPGWVELLVGAAWPAPKPSLHGVPVGFDLGNESLDSRQRLPGAFTHREWRLDRNSPGLQLRSCELSATSPSPGARPGTTVRRIAVLDRSRELRWLKEHRSEFAGKWVAIEADRLVAVGDDAQEVFRAAGQAVASRPLVIQVQAPDQLPFGGW